LTGLPVPSRLRRADERGFTLIECLVAMAIAAVLLTALLQAFSAGLSGSARAEAWSRATIIAQSALDALSATDLIGDSDEERQEGDFHVATTVHRYLVPERPGVATVPYELTVSVSWTGGGQLHSVDLRTLRLGPLSAAHEP
jgi:prepilin-type N-terminal cleavage/methylation domain-containing protein